MAPITPNLMLPIRSVTLSGTTYNEAIANYINDSAYIHSYPLPTLYRHWSMWPTECGRGLYVTSRISLYKIGDWVLGSLACWKRPVAMPNGCSLPIPAFRGHNNSSTAWWEPHERPESEPPSYTAPWFLAHKNYFQVLNFGAIHYTAIDTLIRYPTWTRDGNPKM